MVLFFATLCLLNYSFVLDEWEEAKKNSKTSNGTLQIVFKLCNLRAHSISFIHENQTNLCDDSMELP